MEHSHRGTEDSKERSKKLLLRTHHSYSLLKEASERLKRAFNTPDFPDREWYRNFLLYECDTMLKRSSQSPEKKCQNTYRSSLKPLGETKSGTIPFAEASSRIFEGFPRHDIQTDGDGEYKEDKGWGEFKDRCDGSSECRKEFGLRRGYRVSDKKVWSKAALSNLCRILK
jgi:hypothetical protein